MVVMWFSPSPRGSSVWIISWKMVFLMVLLCKEAELPPRWRDGFNWGKRRLRSRQPLTTRHELVTVHTWMEAFSLGWQQGGQLDVKQYVGTRTLCVWGTMCFYLQLIGWLFFLLFFFLPLTDSCPLDQEGHYLHCPHLPVCSNVFQWWSGIGRDIPKLFHFGRAYLSQSTAYYEPISRHCCFTQCTLWGLWCYISG